MSRTLGYHIVLSCYGLWLPGDRRGHWSDIWDEQIGFIEPHTLHEGDPVRQRMAEERMKHDPLRMSPEMIKLAVETLERCCAASEWNIAAASIERTHTHLLLTYTERDIDITVKWLKDQITKAIHRGTDYDGPVWCRGKWRSYIFDPFVWLKVTQYIERHNIRRGESARPYSFITAVNP